VQISEVSHISCNISIKKESQTTITTTNKKELRKKIGEVMDNSQMRILNG